MFILVTVGAKEELTDSMLREVVGREAEESRCYWGATLSPLRRNMRSVNQTNLLVLGPLSLKLPLKDFPLDL